MDKPLETSGTAASTTPARDAVRDELDAPAFDFLTSNQRTDLVNKIHAAIEEARLAGLTDYQRDVLKAAEENHIWINAFTLVRPSDETYRNVGRALVEQLTTMENTIVSEFHRPGGLLSGVTGPSSRELVIRVNQS